jgi:hypothetical protein
MMETTINLEPWGTKEFSEVSVGSGKKLRREDRGGFREVEPINGDIVISKGSNVDRDISVVTHLKLSEGKAREGVIAVSVRGNQFVITHINVDVEDGRSVGSEEVPYKIPKKLLGDKLEELHVRLEKVPSEDGKRWRKIQIMEIQMRFPGESRMHMILMEPAFKDANIDVGHEEVQLQKCLETHPELEKWRRRSELHRRMMGEK